MRGVKGFGETRLCVAAVVAAPKASPTVHAPQISSFAFWSTSSGDWTVPGLFGSSAPSGVATEEAALTTSSDPYSPTVLLGSAFLLGIIQRRTEQYSMAP